ncbi:uncharacterized protein [Nicotiana sylvestris]|uniref:uncharacterized protein n=1 Tax=Nicotiana sylvestris TaxID=4096 RepID=UPI00388CD812
MKKNAEGVDVPKTRADCNAEDLRKWEKNAKANKWLVCGLGPDEYSRIQSCTTAKKIWDTLQVAHEGTPKVKRSRGTLLYSQYKNFTMEEGETIQEIYTRFTTLANELKSLGRVILEEDKVEKILTMVLPVTWESKITAIQESKNIATLKLDELIVNLTAYELRRQAMKMDAPKKERSLRFKITEGADLEEDKITMITKKFKKYLMIGKGPSRSGSYNKQRVPEKQTNEGCYKCGKTDHHIKNCPQWEIEWKKERSERRSRKKGHVQPKGNKGSTKAMVATWGDTSDEESEDEVGDEQALMAIGESDDEQEEGTSKEIDTPIVTSTKLDIDEPRSSVDQKLYRGMIGSLLYLTANRPDIVFSVGLCARFQANSKESHLAVVKRILRYLKGTTDLCLWYPKDSFKSATQGEESGSSETEQVSSDSKVSPETISKVAANLENRFVGSIAGVETTESGEVGVNVTPKKSSSSKKIPVNSKSRALVQENGAKDAEIERPKKRLVEVETKRDALRTELAREKEKNDGILQGCSHITSVAQKRRS